VNEENQLNDAQIQTDLPLSKTKNTKSDIGIQTDNEFIASNITDNVNINNVVNTEVSVQDIAVLAFKFVDKVIDSSATIIKVSGNLLNTSLSIINLVIDSIYFGFKVGSSVGKAIHEVTSIVINTGSTLTNLTQIGYDKLPNSREVINYSSEMINNITNVTNSVFNKSYT
jgi:hypothetical protein